MIVNLLHLVRMIAWGWEEPWAYLVGEGNFITLIYCIQATMNVTSINLIPYLGCHFSKENWKMLYLFILSITKGWKIGLRFAYYILTCIVVFQRVEWWKVQWGMCKGILLDRLYVLKLKTIKNSNFCSRIQTSSDPRNCNNLELLLIAWAWEWLGTL